MFRDDQPLAWTYHQNSCTWRWSASTEAADARVETFKEYQGAKLLPLHVPGEPAPDLVGLIRARRSCRSFGGDPLPVRTLSALLRNSYGTLEHRVDGGQETFRRPVPSGGGLYALEQYVIALDVDGVAPGVWHYHALHHALEQVDAKPVGAGTIDGIFLRQGYLAGAAAVVVMTAVPARALWRYGDRGYRYLLLEAGHVAQNLNLLATALDVGSLNLGGFLDEELAALLRLDPEEEFPIYSVAVGNMSER